MEGKTHRNSEHLRTVSWEEQAGDQWLDQVEWISEGGGPGIGHKEV